MDIGFTLEVSDKYGSQQYSYPKKINTGRVIEIGEFTVLRGKIVSQTLNPELTPYGVSHEKWGVKTETLVPVDTVMFSPNYWDSNSVGNKHWFFFLKGCKNPVPTRGIYNEFLMGGLEKHRKVFEVLGDRTKCEPSDNQLSGVGFSSTISEEVIVAVKFANKQQSKTYSVKFN
jgi:hypothetical protein